MRASDVSLHFASWGELRHSRLGRSQLSNGALFLTMAEIPFVSKLRAEGLFLDPVPCGLVHPRGHLCGTPIAHFWGQEDFASELHPNRITDSRYPFEGESSLFARLAYWVFASPFAYIRRRFWINGI